MNSIAVVVLVITLFVPFALSLPVEEKHRLDGLRLETELEMEEPDILTPEEGERGVRFRRVTCDVLSVSTPIGSVNHAACALHCISKNKGFKGGRCNNGVCHCRK